MSKIRDTKLFVLNKLKTLPVCIPNGTETQWVIRCPYCGDSRDPSHGHLSINIDLEDDSSPMMYNCFKCPASGKVTEKFLKDIDLTLSPIEKDELKKINKKTSKLNKFTNEYIQRLNIPKYINNKENIEKLNYINNRLGLNLTLDDCEKFRLVLDLYQFLSFNNIFNIPNVSDKFIWVLNKNYIGFLSASNNQIVFRNIYENKYNRYNKIEFNPKNKNSISFYAIPENVDILSNQKINIHISEGIFDILSIYNNINYNKNETNLFFAACGFSLINIIKYIIFNGLGGNLSVNIYCDNDKTDDEVLLLLRKNPEYKIWIDELILHRNTFTDEKDYGVIKEKIIDSYRIIKKI